MPSPFRHSCESGSPERLAIVEPQFRETLDLLERTLDHVRGFFVGSPTPIIWEKMGHKNSSEEVSETDIIVERTLIDSIRHEHPNAAIISEEHFPHIANRDSDLCFVIDPIDGTHAYLEGSDRFAVAVSVFSHGYQMLSILDFPKRAERLTAIRGIGTFLNDHRVSVAGADSRRVIRLLVSPSQSANPNYATAIRQLKCAFVWPLSSASAKLSAVATGQADAALYFPGEGQAAAIWDLAPGALAVHEAGGQVMSFDGQSLLDQIPLIHRGGWLASNGVSYNSILQLFQNPAILEGGNDQ